MPSYLTSSAASIMSWPSAYTGDPAINGLLSGYKWGSSNPAVYSQGVQLDYSFPSFGSSWAISGAYGSPAGFGEPWNGFRPLNSIQQAAASAAMDSWGSVANIRPRLVADGTNVGDIRFGFTSKSPGPNTAAFAYYPSGNPVGGDIWLMSGVAANDRPVTGSYGYHTLLHEIGHAIGLKHAFEAVPGGPPAMPSWLDGLKYTQMSYSDRAGAPNVAANTFPTTPMLYDILAAQHLYGVNTGTNNGNDVYIYSQGGTYWQTIWDGGGNDTIRWIGSQGVTINLNPGTFSTLGNPITFSDGARDPETVAIAFGAMIENAQGDAGDDVLIGNSLDNSLSGGGGNDWLAGNAGRDLLTGGGGADVFRFSRGTGRDVVTDFTPGLDRLSFSADLGAALRVQAQVLPDLVLRGPGGALVDWQMDGARIAGGGAMGAPGAGWRPVALADLTGDGRADILLRGDDGMLVLWGMAGRNIAGGGVVGNPGAGWDVAGVADFNGDGRPDVLLRDAGGAFVLWQMDGSRIIGGGAVASPGAAWKIAALADFSGDGRADILLRNDSGALVLWAMDGARIIGGGAVGDPGAGWRPVASADFNADGRADLLMRGDDGTLVAWAMNGSRIVGGATLAQLDPGWQVAAWQDMGGDGRPDMLLRHATSGQIVLWNMAGTAIVGGGVVGTPGASWKPGGLRDFDQDGHADLLMRSDADGSLALWQLADHRIVGGGVVGAPGAAWEAVGITQLAGPTGSTIAGFREGDSVLLQGTGPGSLDPGRDWMFG